MKDCANCGKGHLGKPAKRVELERPVVGIPPVRTTYALCKACGGDYDHEEVWRIRQLAEEYKEA